MAQPRARSALAASLAAALLLANAFAAQKRKQKKEEEPETQVLELPKEPPASLTAETARLSFRVTPLSAKGLLSQQVRDALKWLMREQRGIVKLRAFVAGSGDMRRVQAIVSDVFTDKRLALPALTTVQVGSLPLEGAQVVLEGTGVERKIQNPHGLAFLSGQAASIEQPAAPVAPLAEQSLSLLRGVLKTAGLEPGDVVRATCYLSSLEDLSAVRQRVVAEYPKAALNLLQRVREPSRSVAECEAVARLRTAPAAALTMVKAPGAGASAAMLVSARRVAFTSEQLAFGFDEPALRLAYQRLGKTLEQAGASFSSVAVAHLYPLSRAIGELAGKVGREFYDPARPPAATTLTCEGLPSLDASFGLDVVAALKD